MDNEHKKKFELELDSIEQTVEYSRLKKEPQPEQEEAEEEPEGSKVVPVSKWRAPKDWRPSGWSDEAASKTGTSFMGKQRSLKTDGKA